MRIDISRKSARAGHVNTSPENKIQSARVYTKDIGCGKVYANGEKTVKPG